MSVENEPDELQRWDDDDADDEEPVSPEVVGQAVVTDTDWTVETLLNQLWRGNIRLNPRFQRRDAWNPVRKSRFIESLVLAFPIPQIVLAEEKDRRGSFLVLDGKQRLLTLLQFAEGSQDSDRSVYSDTRNLRLSSSVEVRRDLIGYDLRRLEQEGSRDDLNGFLNQTIRTVVVRNWPNEAFLNLVFLRLNTGSVSLSPQELRQALHPGPFTDFIDEFAFRSESVRKALRVKQADFRMRDVELVLRFYAFRTRLPRYNGNLKQFMDDTTKGLNKAWSEIEDEIRTQAEELDRAIDAVFEIFGEHAFTRWNPLAGDFERRFNRAVYDIMVYYLSDEATRAAALASPESVRSHFVDACVMDDRFSESLQFTTKSIAATFYRIATWAALLSDALGLEVQSPVVSGYR